MELKTIIPLVVQASLFLLVASIGLQSKWSDLTYTLNKPGLLLRGFLAVNVIVPLVAILVLMPLPIEPAIKVGIVVMAVSPLAPFAPGKMLKAGAETSFVVGLYVALLAISVIAVPAILTLLSAIFPRDALIGVGAVGWLVLKSVVLPLVVGIAVASLLPRHAAMLAKVSSIAGNLTVFAIIIPILFVARHQIGALLGNGTLLAIVLTVLAGLIAGHLLGAPDPHRRMALAQAAATRHPGLAALVLRSNFEDKKSLLAVVLFLLVGIVVSGLYSKWARKRLLPAADPATSPEDAPPTGY